MKAMNPLLAAWLCDIRGPGIFECIIGMTPLMRIAQPREIVEVVCVPDVAGIIVRNPDTSVHNVGGAAAV